MAGFLYRIGAFASRRSGVVIVAWVAILALAGVAFAVGGGHLANGLSIPGTPTAQVTERLATEFPAAAGGNGTIVFRTEDGKPFTDAEKAAISARIGAASDIDGVTQVVDPFATQAARDAQAQQIEGGRTQLSQASAQLDKGQAQLDAARAQATSSGTLDQAAAGLAAKQTELDHGKAQLDAQRTKLELGASLLDMSSGIRLVSDDGSAAVAPVMFTDSQFDVPPATKAAVEDAFSQQPTPGVAVDFSTEIASGIPSILGGGELVGLVIAAIVLIVTLGSLIAAALPIVTALVGVAIGVSRLAVVLGHRRTWLSVTPVLGVMLGLAVGIDYSLFIVYRHRRQLMRGVPLRESIGLATGTSGTAVVFAGSTVFVALLALNVTGIPFLGLMGTVGAVCVAIAVLVAITLAPAILGLVGGASCCGADAPGRRERRLPRGHEEHHADVEPSRDRQRSIGRSSCCWSSPFRRCRCGSACPTARAKPADPRAIRRTRSSTRSSARARTDRCWSSPISPGPRRTTTSSPPKSRIAQQLAGLDDVVAVAPIGTSVDGTFDRVPGRPVGGTEEHLDRTARQAPPGTSPLEGGVQIGVAGQAVGNIDISQALADALPIYLSWSSDSHSSS